GRLLVGCDRLADLLAVTLGRLVQLLRVDLRPDDVGEPLTQREGRARAGRKRDVVRHGGPEADGLEPRLRTRVVEDTDDPRRPLVPRALEAQLLDQLGIARAPRD